MSKRILTIDDDAFLREINAATFANDGYLVESAGDGEEGIATMRRFVPDIVLLDVTLPGADGFEILQTIKADATLRAIPVVMLTGRRGEKDVHRAIELGAIDYLIKPVLPRTLLERVERILDASRNKSEDLWLL